MASLDVDRLHAVPPGQFTAARNRLVAELRQAGRQTDAAVVARLRKPSAALWAVNRVARTDAVGVRRLMDAVEDLRSAQLRDPRAAAAALRAQREALESLVDRARAALAGSGLAGSPAVLRRVGDTLVGAATDRAHAGALRRGTLTEELPAPGFEAFSAVRVPARPLRVVRRAEPSRPGEDGEEEGRRAQARARAEGLEREAAEAQAAVVALERERAAARAALKGLDRRLAEARRLARQAQAAARRARRSVAAKR